MEGKLTIIADLDSEAFGEYRMTLGDFLTQVGHVAQTLSPGDTLSIKDNEGNIAGRVSLSE